MSKKYKFQKKHKDIEVRNFQREVEDHFASYDKDGNLIVDNTLYAEAIVITGPSLIETGTEPITPGGVTLTHSYIKATGLSPGDVHLSDATNWNIDKAHINQVRVITSSVDWDLWILQNDSGYVVNNAVIPRQKIMGNGNGELTLEDDFDYEDEDASKEVHFYIVDNDPGGSNFTIIVRGRPLE